MDRRPADEQEPYLYILMRSDLDSLNPGKAVAQGAHAANQCAFMMRKLADTTDDDATDQESKRNRRSLRLWRQWETSTRQGFGVTICLDVPNDTTLRSVVDAAQSMGLSAGVTHDPSYPLLDGRFLHLIPLDTCGYVFGDKEQLRILLGQFDLLA